MKANRSQCTTWENHAKLLQERIVLTEKHVAELCTTFGVYTKKLAGVRDKNDSIAKALFNYSEAENVNKSLKRSLLEFSKILETMGDYRDVLIQQIETNVVAELSQYEKLSRHAKEEVKNTLASRERELTRKKQLDRLKEKNPRNRTQITAAQVELSKASMEVSNNMKWLEEQMDHFEKKKLQDLKSFLLCYITTELSFHAKAVELFSKGYKEIANVNVNSDLEDFQSFMQDPESTSRLDVVKRTSFKQSLANLFATPTSLKHPEQLTPQMQRKDGSKKNTQDKLDLVHEFEDETTTGSDASDGENV